MNEIELIQIHIRMMEAEKVKLKKEAEAMNMTLQDYCYTRLTKDPKVFIQLQQLLKGRTTKE